MKKETFLTSISIDVFKSGNSKDGSKPSKVFYDLLNLNPKQIQLIIKMVRLFGKNGS